MKMKTVLLGALWIIVSSQAAADPANFKIEEFEFTWKLLTSGKSQLRIQKTQDSTRVVISNADDAISVSPAEAQKIGIALKQTDTMYAKMRGAKTDIRETIDAGDHQITYWQSPRFGFSITVSEKESIVGGRVYLDRKAIKDFTPLLSNAVKMAAYLDKLVDPITAAK